MPNNEKEYVRAVLIDGTADKIKAECDKFLADFKAEYDKLSPSMKETLAKTTITNDKQAKTTLAIMKMANIMNGK